MSMRQMRTLNLPRTTLFIAATATLALTACSGPRVAAESPPGVNFTGLWRLDRAASDDPQKVLEQMRTEARRVIDRQRGSEGSMDSTDGTRSRGRRMPGGAGGSPGGSSGGPGGAGGPLGDDGGDPGASGDGHGPRPDPLRRSPMANIVNGVAARGDLLTIRQGATEVSFDYGNAYRRSFTPGAHSVVSAEGGVGDQVSGWKGRDFLVEVHAQVGPDVSERYSLSTDGRQLLEVLRISGGELKAVELKRIYHPADTAAPVPLPSTD